MSTCGKPWSEVQAAADSTQLYQGWLQGVHAGVVLNFALRVSCGLEWPDGAGGS
jgi:hypothetical protein